MATIFLASYFYDLYNLPSHVFQLCLIIIAIHSIFALMECCAIKDLYKIGIITALFGKLLYVLASLCFMVLAIVYWTSTTRIGYLLIVRGGKYFLHTINYSDIFNVIFVFEGLALVFQVFYFFIMELEVGIYAKSIVV